MIIYGRIIGAVLGLMVLGPVGAILGLLVGFFFDYGLRANLNTNDGRKKETRKSFFNLTFKVMGFIAKSTGRVCEEDINAATKIMAKLELSETQKQSAMDSYRFGKSANFNLDDELRNILNLWGANLYLLDFFIQVQIDVVSESKTNHVLQAKICLLNDICQKLGINPNRFDVLRNGDRNKEQYKKQWQQYSKQWRRSSQSQRQQEYKSYRNAQDTSSNLDRAYQVLGIAKGSTKAQVKKAYRRLISKNHPDKLRAKGLPVEMIKLAKEKTQEIIGAYEIICSQEFA